MANGLFGGGTGTSADPYLVEDAEDLNAVRKYLNNNHVHFKQVQDINMSDFGNFQPIGDDLYLFMGRYNGNSYSIINLKCEHTLSNVGLFGVLWGAAIENIILKESLVTGVNYVGSLVGVLNKGSIVKNCASRGCTIRAASNGGGIAGVVYSSSVLNVITDNSIIGSDYIGGIIGSNYNNSVISNSFALNKSISRTSGSSSSKFGDIAGLNEGVIDNCCSLNTIEFRQL